MKRICIFCASSPRIPQIYFDDARRLAELMAERGYEMVYGGGGVGLMGTMADVMLEHNAGVVGVIPKFMVEVEWQHKGVKEMHLTETMSERKQMMIKMSDAIITLPGSTGTLDELFEAASDKKLGLINKPLVILNTNGFYDSQIVLLQRMVDENFMADVHLRKISVANTPEEAINLCCQTEEPTSLSDAQL